MTKVRHFESKKEMNAQEEELVKISNFELGENIKWSEVEILRKRMSNDLKNRNEQGQ